MSRARWWAGLVAGAVGLGLAGCAEPPEPPPAVEVSGEPGATPDLTFPAPMEVPEQRVEVLAEGTGPALRDGAPVLLDVYAESAVDESVIADSYAGEPRAYLLSAESLGPDLYAALQGRRVGSRVLQIAPGRDGFPATVAVYDLLPTRASGEELETRTDLPSVTLGADGAPSVEVPQVEPPLEAVTQPLIRGTGPQVEPGQVVTVQYLGVTWADGAVFDSTWAAGKLPATFPIGVGSLPAGWDEGLVEQPVGSQVLLVLPPGETMGGTEGETPTDQTLIFVVDILDARGGPEGSAS